ncbi:hypothetical protein [Rhodococcus qingshengii]|uniref:hypothetical protein n=1 Tax=Rhodococcus qingshengii TaxID=334542 RepID=UPI0027D2B80F|nr:hypothetical protein [Rhodococcus qingshengii]
MVVSHAGVVNRLLWMQGSFRWVWGNVVLQKTPVSFDVVGVGVVLAVDGGCAVGGGGSGWAS